MPATTGGRNTSKSRRSNFSRGKVRPQSSGSRGSGAAPRGKGSKPIAPPSPAPSKPKVYVRPTIKSQPGPSSDKERTKVRRAKGEQRKAPKRQPGPSSDRERKKVRKAKQRKPYRRAVRVAQRAGREERRRQLVRSLGASVGAKADTDTKVLGVNVEAELEGRGRVQKAAKEIKKIATSDAGQKGLKSAGVIPPGTPEKVAKNFTKDVVDLPAQAVPSVYAVGAGAVEAVQGRPKRIKQLGESVKEHDPVALAAQGRFGEAAKEVEKHPGLAAASLYGAGSAVSRGAGVGVRASGSALRKAPTRPAKRAGRRLRRIGSTKRAPRVAPGTGITELRRYSKGLGAKAVQVTGERVKIRKARKLRGQARRTRDPERKALLRRKAAQADPRVMEHKGITRRTNEREDLAEVRRRQEVSRAAHEAREALPKDPKAKRLAKRVKKVPGRETPKDHRAAVTLLVAQKVVKPNRDSVQAYKRQIDAERKSGRLDKAETRANRTLSAQLGAALKDKRLDFGKLETAAANYGKVVNPRQKKLAEREIVAPQRERMSKLVPYAVQNMGAKWRKAEHRKQPERPSGDGWERKGESWVRPAGLVSKDGRRIAANEIETHMWTRGEKPPTYVTQAPGQRGARNFFSSWHEPKNVGGKSRTGEATRKGTFEVSRAVGEEGAARAEGLVQATNSYGDWLGENAYRPKGKTRPKDFATKEAAERFRDNTLADSSYDWRIVPTRPQFGRKEQSKDLLDRADSHDAAVDIDVAGGIKRALDDGEGSGGFALVPDVAARTKADHAAILGNRPLKVVKKAGRQFSGTVLTTSGFTWPIGNVAEGAVRLAVIRAGPASYGLARKTVSELRKIDPAKADDLEARIGTGHLGAYEMQKVHAVSKDFQGTAFEKPAQAFGAFARTPGPKQAGQMWNAWTSFVFGKNGALESQLRLAAYGRHLKNEGHRPKWASSGARAMGVAAEQAARGQKGTNAQVAAARFTDRAMGRYGKWSPTTRITVSTFTPFAAWAVNAVKFFTDVLPRDHPVLTGLLATSERVTEEWRNSHGLGRFIDGAAPNWLQPSIVVDGQLVPVGRFTPASFFADPLGTAGSQVFPSFTGILMATRGLDWKGDPLGDYDKAGEVPDHVRANEMRKQAMSAFVPFFGLQERVREKGAKTALNPVRKYSHDQPISAAFDQLERVEKAKAKIKDKYPKVSSDNPTPRYKKLHVRERNLNERIYRRSKGEWGTKYKNPYEPVPLGTDDSSSGGGGNVVLAP